MLLKEIQSLSLDANVVSEGGDVEISEEDDDLLKAAEELGMDLTGVRADGSNGSYGRPTSRGAGGRRGRAARRDEAAKKDGAEAEAKAGTKVED